MRRDDRERGAALLTVLMLVAVIAVMAGGALERLRLSTRLAGNALAGEQARGYAYAAEALALSKVTDQLGRDKTKVSLAGGWSGKPFGLPLAGGGYAVARITDGGNCFNVNGLVTNDPLAATGYRSNGTARLAFVRLMQSIDVPVQAAETIAASASDWIDTDQDQQQSGAEDAAYLGRETPYRTAGTLMSDPSELRAVNGMTPEIYAKLKPWVCALPSPAMSIINVNTVAPEQAPLIAMLLPTATVQAVRQALLKRPPSGFSDTSLFWNLVSLGGGNADLGGKSQTGVTSTWFALAITVSMAGTELEEHALIDATRLPARLAARQWGEDS